MTSSLTSTILCPACSKANEPDSRFCRYCGASLAGALAAATPLGDAVPAEGTEATEAETNVESRIEAHAPLVTPLHVAPAPQLDSTDGEGNEKLSSPGEIDGRRARQLLDRALYLSERGDAAAAILACRQSVALAPTAPAGYSMLGLLLERTGNLPRALAAYEKVVELAPSSTMERESIERLREKLSQQRGPELFHFDDADLFGTDAVIPVPTGAEGKTSQLTPDEVPHLHISAAAPGLPADFGADDYAEEEIAPVEEKVEPPKPRGRLTLAQSIAAQLPSIRPTIDPDTTIPERRQGDRRVSSVPVLTERRMSADRRGTAAAPVYGRAAARAGVAPIFLADVEPMDRRWDKLWQRPSYFGRSLPLAGATILCLGFLLWARSWAVARSNTTIAAAPTIVDPALSAPATAPDAAANPNGSAVAPPPLGTASSASQGGFPISNQPVSQPPQPATAGAPSAAPSGATTSAPTTSANNQRIASAGRRTPPQFPQIIPPAPIPRNSGGTRTTNRSTPPRETGGGGVPGLSAPNLGEQAPAAAPVDVTPSTSSGPALNPAGASGRGYVRITQGRIGSSRLPQRPAAQAGADERGAADAVRNGQSDRAIEQLSSAVNADASDAGFRYQQRAMLFLDRGDYSRAADDFQAAISAYGEQIARGEQVAAARAGQRAARNGLNLALAGRGR